MTVVTHKLSGFRELAEGLRELPQRLAANALRAAAGAGAAEIRREAKRLAPIYTGEVAQGHPPPGTLQKSIYSGHSRSRSKPHSAVAIVSVRRTGKGKQAGAFYASWVEFGHFARGPKSVGKSKAGKAAARAAGLVRWVPPRPYLRPAIDNASRRAIEAVGAKLRARLQVEAARIHGDTQRAK